MLNKTKKILALILAVSLCFSLAACGGKANSQKNPLLLYYETSVLETNVFINIAKLSEILEIVELTTENWNEYIKVYSYSIEKVTTDAFDEVVSKEIITYEQFGAGNERYHCFEDVAIELKHKETGEVISCKFNTAGVKFDDMPEGFKTDDYDCTRIQGKLVFADIPQESLYEVSWDKNKHFSLSTKSKVSYQLTISNGTNAVTSPLTGYLK